MISSIASLAGAAAAAPTASAGEITTWACRQPTGQPAPLDRIDSTISTSGMFVTNGCAGAGDLVLSTNGGSKPGHANIHMWFNAPANTRVSQVQLWRAVDMRSWGSYTLFSGTTPVYDGAHVREGCASAAGCSGFPEGEGIYGMDHANGWNVITESCTYDFGCSDSGPTRVTIKRIGTTLVDNEPPSYSSRGGTLMNAGDKRGNVTLTAQLTDAGVGLRRLRVLVDGTTVTDEVLSTNGGRCSPGWRDTDFAWAQPCPLSHAMTATLNTSQMSDGKHTVRIVVADAAKNETVVFNDEIQTDNFWAPTSTAAPTLATSDARVGATVTATPGRWSASPSATTSMQWFRCPAGVTASVDDCDEIPGATRPTYTLAAADAYKRVIVRELAFNAQGSSSALSNASRVIADEDGSTTSTLPVLITPPQISGTVQVGSRVTATHGTWRSSAIVTDYAYQWRVDGADVDGATSNAFTPTLDLAYRRLSVVVKATNRNGSASTTVEAGPIADIDGRTTPRDDDTGRDGHSRDGDDDGGRRDPGTGGRPGGDEHTPAGPPGPPVPGPDLRPEATPARYDIDGLKNPIAGHGHAPNGTNASENARGRAAFLVLRGKKRVETTVVRSARVKGEVIRGRLLNSAGKPIVGARLVAAWRQAAGGRWTARGLVTTDRAGRFTYRLPKGPSRAVKFVYFAFSDSRSYSESNTVSQKVRTPIRLRVAPRAASNGRSVRFTGAVSRTGLPKRGVLVTLEARYPGARWKQFKVVRTSRAGAFTATYRFTSTTTRTAYSFRARVAKQTAYPFEGGISKRTKVVVAP